MATPATAEGVLKIIEQGESVESIAAETGHLWHTIWNHGNNTELRQKRTSPHILHPGDELFIPDVELREAPKPTDAKHRFRLKAATIRLKLLVREQNRPLANKPYVLVVDGTTYNGSTSGSGIVEAVIPAGSREGTLLIEPGTPQEKVFRLDLGHLDPITEVSGWQGRLRNLGFFAGSVDGERSEALADAIRAFQQANSLPETGEMDGATRARLESEHGS